MKATYLLLILCLGFFDMGYTQESEVQVSVDTSYADDVKTLWERETISGNWGGLRTDLKENGFIFKSSLTNFYQGMVNGEGNNDFEFGSKFGFTTILNGEKIGLWKGFFAIARMEYNMGQSVNGRGGTLLPVNMALYLPGIEGADRWDMNFYFIQFLSKTDKLVLGKINNIDLSNFSTFHGGLGIRNFYHNALVSPPNAITAPYVFGAYYMSSNTKRDMTFAVYDSNSRVNKMGFGDLFEDGVTFFGSYNFVTHFFGMKGKQGLMGAYSTKNVRNLNDIEDFFPPTGEYIGEKSNRWSATYFFEQTLFRRPEYQKQAFGLFGQLGLTDGKGSFADYFFTLGFGGDSPFRNRVNDKWGMGYFYYSLSDGLSDLNIPTIPGVTPGFTMNSYESGWEGFYEYYLSSWLTLGADVQIIAPGIDRLGIVRTTGTTFLGFRSKINF